MEESRRQIIPHILFPLKLPGNAGNIVKEERCLLTVFQDFLSTQNFGMDIRTTIETFSVWKEMQDNHNVGFVAEKIGALQPGQFLALYIRAQNAGVIISIPEKEANCCNTWGSAILSTFPASQTSSSVTTAPGDLVYTFPTKSIHVPKAELISSKTIARQLIELNSSKISDAMPKTIIADELFDEDRDVPDPKFIANWICGSLCNQDSVLCKKFPQIVKKVRDEVVIPASQEMPFRRSGLWMTMKTTLQLLLISELGPSAGKHLYKTILLRFLCTFCDLTCIDADLGVQFMAKIARRYYKLSKIQDFTLKKLLIDLQGIVSETVEGLRSRLDKEWREEIERDADENKLKLSGNFNFQDDTWHPLLEARKELAARDAATDGNTANSSVPIPVGPPRDRSISQFTNLEYLAADDEEALGMKLFDFERNVKHWDSFVKLDNCVNIHDHFINYHRKASKYYKLDPIGISRMTLTCLKIIQIVDKMVCKRYPMLKEHRHGVPIEIVQHLMLPFREDLQLADSLEKYFDTRNSVAKNPGLLEEQNPSKDAYSVRHAMSDETMKLKLEEILLAGEESAQSKLEEVERERKEYKRELQKIQGMSCSYEYNWYDDKVHSSSCRKCACQRHANNMTVRVYMYPLPDMLEAQNAIVFELLIPEEIACLRDILAMFLKKQKTLIKGARWKTAWTQHEQLNMHCRRKKSWIVDLGTANLPICRSHFKKLHPSQPGCQFVVKNDCGTLMCMNEMFVTATSDVTEDVLKKFVFQVEKNSPYAKLQWTLDKHDFIFSQNEILARQSECPSNLKLTEFIEFGTMRAGHRIQLRNLYRALKLGSLSLRTESVFNLICQVLWRAGPNSVQPSVVRESHEDLLCKEFLEELLLLMASMIGGFAENWNDNRSLTTCIVILLRVFSVSEDASVLEKCFDLLKKCREIVLKWCRDIEGILGSMGDSPVEQQNEFRRKLVEVAACGSMTFWADLPDSKKYLADDLKMWLLSVKTIQDNIIMSSKNVAELPKTLRNQLRRIRECGIANENHFHELLSNSYDTLNDFIRIAWSGAGSVQEIGSMTWNCCDHVYEQVYEARLKISGVNTVFHVDLISGIFHVNGKPVGLLPREILKHTDYSRVFGEYVFEVQSAQSPGTVISKYKYRQSNMEFAMKGGMLFITEISPKSATRYEYVPNIIFSKELPYVLIHNFTHWWNKKDEHIIFRQLESKENFEAYRLDLKTGLITENTTGRLVINIASKSYIAVVLIFKRLEQEKHIAIFTPKMDKNCNRDQLDVILPQMRLNFTVTKNIEHILTISSLEFPGMNVTERQKRGTLVGLASGLMLEPKKDYHGRKVILIPHGCINFYKKEILIDTNSLKSPRYFAYEVDDRLQQLKSGQTKAATAYLAYLHAVTSHPLPDPFTGHTGTERALQILQSGHCWSCEPFDAETISTLNKIAKLSPKRGFYSKTKRMTQVVWPTNLNSLCCSDAYQIIVKKLVEDSNRLSFLFPNEKEHKIKFESNEVLCRKSYWRYFKCTTEQSQIADDFLKLEYPAMSIPEEFDFYFSAENVKTMLKLICLCDQWKHSLYENSHLLSSLIRGKSKLDGCTRNGFPYKCTFVDWTLKDFWDFWLDLYNLARTVVSQSLHREWTMILSYYAFKGVPEQHLILLQTIAVNYKSFENLNPPSYSEYKDPEKNYFDYSAICETITRSPSVNFEDYLGRRKHLRDERKETGYEFTQKMKKKYNNSLTMQSESLTYDIKNEWPINACDAQVTAFPRDNEIPLNVWKVIQEVNLLLENWYHNYELEQFVTEVENRVISLGRPKYNVDNLIKNICNSAVPLSKHDVPTKAFKLSDVDCPCDSRAYSEAEATFSRGNIDTLNPIDLSEFSRFEDSGIIASVEAENLLSDPIVRETGCKIWEQLVSSLQVSESERQTVPKKSRALEYDQNLFKKLAEQFEQRSAACKNKSREFWKLALSPVQENSVFKILSTSGIFPRLTPVTLLPLICHKVEKNRSFRNCLRKAIGAYAVSETLDQHALRCRRYVESANSQVELQRELDSAPHENWSPSNRPEWLLFEIEADLLVRPVQMQVAEQMENPIGTKNAVMQLNMGEGKTTVITPLLLLRLANKKQLCRLTVLRAMFNTNVHALQLNLGGLLLNRRIYSFPCRRDYTINCTMVQKLFEVYKECCDMGGVNVSTPEYRLSFQLKGYEQCRADSHDIAEVFLQIQQWLNDKSRDILDESDELLHVKYQLIYALGAPTGLSGGALRWTVLQNLLLAIPEVIREVGKLFGMGTVEISEDSPRGTFPPCRLLKAEAYRTFCEFLADRVLDGKVSSIVFVGLFPRQKNLLRKFLTEEVIKESTFAEVYEFLKSEDVDKFKHMALILRGLMACGVLFAAFNKRWRVNYGVNPVGKQPLAVPFRAKDVAAERTEFGHPDVALVLTHLSYYYSGLNDSQLDECFACLYREPEPETVYSQWIRTVDNPNETIRELKGINFSNTRQKMDILYFTLRKNKAVIDYWLGNVILPIKARQFHSKMICSAWDLASDRASNSTTGFSGTNDSRLLLPVTISQKDIPELKWTNYQVFQNLLLEENNAYWNLAQGITAMEILEKLAEKKIPLLLDVGALMLELDNEGVAKKWLELTKNDEGAKDAAIYFNSDNRLMVQDRSVLPPVRFEISPYRNRLDRCVIYLDDIHTRGTDLKIPSGTKGCVTLGKGVTKDKLVQGCMRMRKLGRGHTVCFWASDEVHNEIVHLIGEIATYGSAHVLKWALNNSRNTIKEGFPHWVAAACNYIENNKAQEVYGCSEQDDGSREHLFNEVSRDEIVDLEETYGRPWKVADFPHVAEQQLRAVCESVNANERLQDYSETIVQRCRIYIPDLTKNVHLLDEEQERELELEIEEECEVSRPGALKPRIPKLYEGIVKTLRNMDTKFSKDDFPEWAMRLPLGLTDTSLEENINELGAWGNDIFITRDFAKTIKLQLAKDTTDSFLRPVNWIVSFMVGDSPRWLLMSPYEVNELIAEFRHRRFQASLHMYTARLTPEQSTLSEIDNLVLPTGTNVSLVNVPRYCELHASLFIFSGCTFFGNRDEMSSFCNLTGYAPYPRTAEEEQAFENQLMDRTGFLLPSEIRNTLRPLCRFQRNPGRLIEDIIIFRSYNLPEYCHVSKILHECSLQLEGIESVPG